MSEYRPQRFSILPPVVKNLLIINVLIFLFLMFDNVVGRWLYANLALYMPTGWALQFPPDGTFFPTQLITYMFLHSNAGFSHLFFNMFALWMFGMMVENVWGARRFLTYYLVTGIGAGIVHIIYLWIVIASEGYSLSDFAGYPNLPSVVGASGAIYGVLVAYGYLFPNSYVNIYFFIPVKAKYFVLILIGIDLVFGFTGSDNVAHFAHLGGALVGFLWLVLGRYKSYRNY